MEDKYAPQKAYRLRNIQKGLCQKCAKPAEPGRAACLKHLSRKAEYDRKRRVERREAGFCTSCRSKKVRSPDCNTCQGCYDSLMSIKRTWQKDQRERIARGVCMYCGDETTGMSRFCRPHHLRQMAHRYVGGSRNWQILSDLYDAQGGKCAYTGIDITIGVDASVDHKYPHGRFPDLESKVDNLVWCHTAVNTVKNKLTHEEFGWLCHRVAKHLPDFDIPADRMTEIMDNAFAHRGRGDSTPERWS